MIIKDKAIAEDDWTLLKPDGSVTPHHVAVPEGRHIVPLSVWLAQHETLRHRTDVGVWLASCEEPEALLPDIETLPLIAVDFPKFADGRGYTTAYALRVKMAYRGELRAIGDVLRDQLFYMQRVGFNAFAVRQDKDIHDAIKGLADFSESYQASVDQPLPLFRRVQRGIS